MCHMLGPMYKKKRGIFCVLKKTWDFPGGSMVKNPPASAGDSGSLPDLEQSHMPWNNSTDVPHPFGLGSRAWQL